MAVPISNVTRRVVYTASGTGPYAFTFEILANTDIAVYKDDTLLTLTTDYTVTIASNGTGSITLVTSPTGATQIAIVGNRTIQRTTDFVTGGDFFANTVNDEMDQQTIFAQQNAEGLQRALQAPQTDPTNINMVLPRKADRAGKYLAFDSNGNPEAGPTSADVDVVAGIADEVVTVAGIASSVTTVAGISSAVSTVSGNTSNVNTVAGISGNVTTVAGISSNVTTVAGISSNVSTVAGISSAVSTVATNATAVSTVSTNITSVQSAATNMAAIIDAPTQATNAANSASAASSSATSAASSAAAAASALDSFDDRYLGSKSSDPTLDNDGNALLTGALYYNTTTQTMKVYDGANWITATAAGTTAMLVYKYVATAGQTTFSGAATVGGTMSYTSGNIIVFLNGASLDSTDYTATNGTSVVLGSAASLNDELVIVAFKSFTVADTYTKGEVDAFAVKLTGAQTVAGVKTFSDRPLFSGGIDLNANGQIKFPAAQNASADANTLDDYEEGTWTPTLVGGTNPTVTYTTQRGNYVKIGRQVFASFYLAISSFSGGSGAARLGGLPFTAAAIGAGAPDDNGGSLQEHNGIFSYPAGRTWVTLYVVNGGTVAPFIANGSGAGGLDMTIGTNVISTNGYILGSVTYTSA